MALCRLWRIVRFTRTGVRPMQESTPPDIRMFPCVPTRTWLARNTSPKYPTLRFEHTRSFRLILHRTLPNSRSRIAASATRFGLFFAQSIQHHPLIFYLHSTYLSASVLTILETPLSIKPRHYCLGRYMSSPMPHHGNVTCSYIWKRH
jgi:hypothetical protein